ncbi:MAG: polysaccharide deacetylase family protein [Hyphomicrobium sp.]|nr:polysaccharide deacetylase family protein [Hyphomicrobium sp.]
MPRKSQFWTRMARGVSAALCLVGLAEWAEAGKSGQPVSEAPASEHCASRTDVLGVSRVLELDTAGGPRFGLQQYRENDILGDKEVILTFDDGPMRRFTVPILDALDAQCTKATFFVVGRMALADPATLKETDRRGHTIATHTWSHKRLHEIGEAKARTDVELGISATALALGKPPAPFFRFPYLGDSRAMRAHLEKRDVSAFSIDVDSRDFTTKSSATVIRNVMSQLATKGKGIVLFHDIQPSTSAAVTKLLAELRDKGYKVVHIVPRSPVATLPEYDAMAAKEAARRQIAKAGDPLADRSVVWPVSPGKGDGDELPWLKPATVEAVEPTLAPSSDRARPGADPDNPAGAAADAAPKLRRKPIVEDDSSWATSPLSLP